MSSNTIFAKLAEWRLLSASSLRTLYKLRCVARVSRLDLGIFDCFLYSKVQFAIVKLSLHPILKLAL